MPGDRSTRAIEPEAPAIALQASLAAAFPSLPLYGGVVEDFVPHVSIVEGAAADDSAIDGIRRGTTCR